jgi:hypothetical protein
MHDDDATRRATAWSAPVTRPGFGGPRCGPARPRAEIRVGLPWQAGLAALSWVGLGAIMLAHGLGLGRSPGDDTQRELITGSLGPDTVVSTVHRGGGSLSVLLGVAVLILAALLALGQGWTRTVLTSLGGGTVLILALAGRWETLPAMLLLIVGAVLPLAPHAHRYLAA